MTRLFQEAVEGDEGAGDARVFDRGAGKIDNRAAQVFGQVGRLVQGCRSYQPAHGGRERVAQVGADERGEVGGGQRAPKLFDHIGRWTVRAIRVPAKARLRDVGAARDGSRLEPVLFHHCQEGV